ncbi:SRPBCC family protein [Lentilitoribacter sp. Alg239-R112]|uniref:SRPBCC family protein n=1 Tax=Lentilitoribacter sp. Alg239-R112 TaxID=2305987 RepID=UPI0013A6B9A2|nr:SRPBCC family protein [Lentilitoribacter sp. Alg239-R112]
MTNQIIRSIHVNVPIERLWVAVTDHMEFGTWFRVTLNDQFAKGKVIYGKMTLPGHEGLPFWIRIEAMEEPNYFSFSWPIDETIEPDDPNIEGKTTLVTFILEPHSGGSKLTIRESGFEKLPNQRRLQVFRDNQVGWEFQTANIQEHLK